MRNWMVTIRKKEGFSQQRLADLLGVKRQAISAIERGVCDPKPALAKELGRILDVDWTIFYEREGHDVQKKLQAM